MAFEFRDREALQVVMTTGLCPSEMLAKPARVADGPEGRLIVAPDEPVSQAVIAKLRAAGVAVHVALPVDARAVTCWAEAIRPERVAVDAVPSTVVFVVDDIVALAAELVRLGCERFELLIGNGFGVARVVDPPTYTAMRGLDRDGVRVFAPDPPRQDVVWTELGYRHPLASRLRAEPGALLLVAADRWMSIPDRGWLPLDAVIELAVPSEVVTLEPGPPPRRRIELRLANGRRDAPSLWVIREGGVAAIDRLLEHLPDDVVARLTFAVAGTIVVLRARPTGRQPAPDLALDAETYAPLAHMADVLAPSGSIVEPPLGRDRLRTILRAGAGDVVWLAPAGGSKFRVERIADDAFTPLSEWADYVVHAHAPALKPWTVSSVFELAPFVSTGLEWNVDEPAATRKRRAPATKKKRGARAAPLPAAPPVEPPAETVPTLSVADTDASIDPIVIDRELAALETAFVKMDTPGDDPQRLALLGRLAQSYRRLGRRRDAGLCFVRVAWESPLADASASLTAWIDAGLAGVDAALASSAPDADDVRDVALVAAAGAVVDPHRVTRWLDDHDGELDARTLWLSRLGLAKLSGGDPLGLAHVRDRILARLAGGLPVERELPAFLRFGGRAAGVTSGDHLIDALDDLAGRIASTKRQRSSVEAPIAYTNAYVAFVLAYGYARTGKPARARELVSEATRGLAPAQRDPVHAYLAAAFTARIDQAIAGQPREAPLPEALVARRTALADTARYTVDRLREASRILEPVERLAVIDAFKKRTDDVRGPEFAALRSLSGLARIAAVEALVAAAIANEAERPRLLDGIFDVLVELPHAPASDMLARSWPLVATVAESRRAVLYAEALVVAGHFGRRELVGELLDHLGDALRTVGASELQLVLEHGLRALRRIGLRAEIAELLASAEAALGDNLVTRLAFAGGLAFLGDTARALPIIDEARRRLAQPMTTPDRIAVIRALAQAYAHAPLPTALTGILELSGQLVSITDTFGTNSHYCLSVLHVVESLVAGIASDDLALDAPGRRFVEDDEHLIRRRLFTDLGGTR